jgi:hypothetical protein
LYVEAHMAWGPVTRPRLLLLLSPLLLLLVVTTALLAPVTAVLLLGRNWGRGGWQQFADQLLQANSQASL